MKESHSDFKARERASYSLHARQDQGCAHRHIHAHGRWLQCVSEFVRPLVMPPHVRPLVERLSNYKRNTHTHARTAKASGREGGQKSNGHTSVAECMYASVGDGVCVRVCDCVVHTRPDALLEEMVKF